jgi:hypothetical protein
MVNYTKIFSESLFNALCMAYMYQNVSSLTKKWRRGVELLQRELPAIEAVRQP